MRRLLLAGVAVAVLTAPAAADTRRVAVLDFINTTKDQAVEWLGPAAAATITTKLNAVHSLQLVERAQLYRNRFDLAEREEIFKRRDEINAKMR